jgi:serralysin
MTGETGIRALSHQNISIAYNTIIENAVGGSQRDYLVGNDVANKLTGNGGNDTIRGLGGDDILSGGAGSDRFVYGPGEGGTDTIKDFQTGIDKIDLHELVGVTAQDVTFQNGKLFIDVDNNPGADLTIVIQGGTLNLANDILFG